MGKALPAAHALLDRVEEPLRGEVLAAAERVAVSRGGTIYDRHRFRRCLGLVLRGRIQVRRETLLVSTLSAGDVFGAAALFTDREDYPTTLTALTDCELLLIPQEGVLRMLRESPGFAEAYVVYLSGRIQFLSSRLDAVSAGSAEGKLARYLLSAADEEGRVDDSATRMCQRIGVGRATLYRAFGALEQTGAIARERGSVWILDAKKLEAESKKGKEVL